MGHVIQSSACLRRASLGSTGPTLFAPGRVDGGKLLTLSTPSSCHSRASKTRLGPYYQLPLLHDSPLIRPLGFRLASVTWLRACLLHLYPTPIPAAFASALALASPRHATHIAYRISQSYSRLLHDAPSHAVTCPDTGAARNRYGFLHI